MHAWGMTEMSPLGTLARAQRRSRSSARPTSSARSREKQGRAIFGVDMKIVDDDGAELPWDGRRVRRPARARAVGDRRATSARTTSTARRRLVSDRRRRHHRPRRLHAHHRPQQGRDQVGRRMDQLDRPREHRDGASGGRGGGVHRRARIRSGTSGRCSRRASARARRVTRDELLAFYDGKVAKWWIPDDVVFVDELPHTARPASCTSCGCARFTAITCCRAPSRKLSDRLTASARAARLG